MSKLLKYYKPYLGRLALAVVTIACNALVTLSLPNMLSRIINIGITTGDRGYILRTGIIMLGLTLLGVLMAVVTSFLSSRTALGVARDLRDAVFTKVEGFSLVEFDRFETSSLITRTTNDINQIQQLTVMFIRIFVMAPIMLTGGVFMAFSKSPVLARIIMMAIPLLALLVFTISRFVMPLMLDMQKRIDQINLVMREKLTGVRVIRAFTTEGYEEQRFAGANRDLTDTALRMHRYMSGMMPGMFYILNILSVLVVWNGGLQVSYGNILVGDILAVTQYIMQILMSVAMMSMVFVMLPRANASAERIDEVLKTEPVISDGPQAVTGGNGEGGVEFKDVSFFYPGSDEPALSDITFKALPGQITAVIGSTGSGKSTLVNLIIRLYDASQGAVLVDGVDVREYSQQALREKMGYVPQRAVLFSGTVEENIRYGAADATDEQVRAAAAIAQADDFVSERDGGYTSEITQGGSNLSGGQKQRMSIARAIVRSPEVFIFDDSFSALDFKTESRLRAALASRTEHATVFVVAQRVSSIMHAEQILVLNEGRLVGKGDHSTLMETCEVYREIVFSQLSSTEVAG